MSSQKYTKLLLQYLVKKRRFVLCSCTAELSARWCNKLETKYTCFTLTSRTNSAAQLRRTNRRKRTKKKGKPALQTITISRQLIIRLRTGDGNGGSGSAVLSEQISRVPTCIKRKRINSSRSRGRTFVRTIKSRTKGEGNEGKGKCKQAPKVTAKKEGRRDGRTRARKSRVLRDRETSYKARTGRKKRLERKERQSATREYLRAFRG